MLTTQTHYEQVPLEIVRKITEKQREQSIANDGAAGSKTPVVETAKSDATKAVHGNDQAFEYPAWQKPCQEALVELDGEKLKQRVEEAEAAIFQRFQELAHSPNEQAERQALMDVTSSLRSLKRDVLKYPDWETSAKT